RDKISGYKSGEEIKLARHSKEMLEKNQKLAALEFINQAVKIAPEIPELYNQRARVYTELNENSKARTDLLTAAKLAPFEKAKFFIEVAKAFSRSGEIDSTVFWIKKAISTDSSYIDALV